MRRAATILPGTETTPPAWFTDALAVPVEIARVRVAGVELGVRSWGDPMARGVVLIHGVAAHARWWDHVAPLLAHGRTELRVTAVDLSGHGTSDRREWYGIDRWADEVLDLAAHPLTGRAPVLVGHSLGGLVAVSAAARGAPAGVIAVDSAVRNRDARRETARRRLASRPPVVYPTAEEAHARFRPSPDQACLGYVLDHIARTSVLPVARGWSWAHDPRVFDRPTLYLEDLRPVRCPVGLVQAGRGRLTEEDLGKMRAGLGDRMGDRVAVFVMPEAGHHPMLDRPLDLVEALRTLLAGMLCGHRGDFDPAER